MSLLSTSQVSKLTGATLRQLQWWDEQGYVVPMGDTGKNVWRRYGADDIARIRFLLAWRKKGLSQARCRALLRRVRAMGWWPLDAGLYLVLLQGDNVKIVATEDQVARLSSRENGPVVVIRWK